MSPPKKTPPSKKKAATPTVTVAPKRKLLRVTTRALFTRAGSTAVHWAPGNGEGNMIRGATIKVGAVSGTTNRFSVAELDLASLPDGPATMTFEPPPGMVGTTRASPSMLATTTSPPDRLFRALSLSVTIKSGALDPSASTAFGQAVDNAQVTLLTQDKLEIDWKPDWIKCPRNYARPAPPNAPTPPSPKLIILHSTDADNIGSTLHRFTAPGGKGYAGANYIVDVDGFVVKMVRDEEAVGHAGQSFFRGTRNVSDISIGIETVHRGSGAFPKAQMDALLALIRALEAAHGLGRHTVFAHYDVQVERSENPPLNLTMTGRHACPGGSFDYAPIMTGGVGTGRISRRPSPSDYGGLFSTFPTIALARNDKDGSKIYGGKVRSAIVIPVIREIQSDLKSIGYSINERDGTTETGEYDDPTIHAIQAFQRHFMNARDSPTGFVDAQTAAAIKEVLGDLATP
ncbi:N-acetylmuramoyl-L-alanine amidase [Pendulispora albinea]|uniref:N-acetylmuramoyl-L-alanine amidase n=1 Tax=Pendulispora albinea TaxID=2741071 RepID=A0ABZ2MA27_9BACT